MVTSYCLVAGTNGGNVVGIQVSPTALERFGTLSSTGFFMA